MATDINPADIPTEDALKAKAEKAANDRQHNAERAYDCLATLRGVIQKDFWSDRKAATCKMITDWDARISDTVALVRDISSDDLGAVYRSVANSYNHMADNLRDESHETTVDR